MARSGNYGPEEFSRPLRRVLVGLLVLVLLALFLLWRIDSPRVERFRTALVDRGRAVVFLGDGAGDQDRHGHRQLSVLRPPLRTEPAPARRIAADEGVERGRAAAGAEERPPAGPEPGAAGPDADPCDRRGAGRQRQPVPPVGAAERRRARRHPRRLGHDGRHRSGRPHFGRGRADQPRDPADRQQQPHSGRRAALGPKGHPVGRQFHAAAAGFSGTPRPDPARRPGRDLGRWRGVSGGSAGRLGRAGQRQPPARDAEGRLSAAGIPARPAQPSARADHRQRPLAGARNRPNPCRSGFRARCGRATGGGND